MIKKNSLIKILLSTVGFIHLSSHGMEQDDFDFIYGDESVLIPVSHYNEPLNFRTPFLSSEESSSSEESLSSEDSSSSEESTDIELSVEEESFIAELTIDEPKKCLRRKFTDYPDSENSQTNLKRPKTANDIPGYLPIEHLLDKLVHLSNIMNAPPVILLENTSFSVSSQNMAKRDLLIQQGIIKSDELFYKLFFDSIENSNSKEWLVHLINNYINTDGNVFNIENIKIDDSITFKHIHGRAFQIDEIKDDNVVPLYYVKICTNLDGRSAGEVFDNIQLNLIQNNLTIEPYAPKIILPIKSLIVDTKIINKPSGLDMEEDAEKNYVGILFMPIAQGKSFENLLDEFYKEFSEDHPIFEAVYYIGKASGVFKKQFSVNKLQTNEPWITLTHPDSNEKNIFYHAPTKTVSWIDHDDFGVVINKWAENWVKYNKKEITPNPCYLEIDGVRGVVEDDGYVYEYDKDRLESYKKINKTFLEGFLSVWDKKYHPMISKILIKSLDNNIYLQDMGVNSYKKIIKRLSKRVQTDQV